MSDQPGDQPDTSDEAVLYVALRYERDAAMFRKSYPVMPDELLPTEEAARLIRALLAERRTAVATVQAEREACAKVAETALRAGAPLCPYGRDKPGDPTWDHIDDDICPVCRKNAHESLNHCTDSVGSNIAAAIRARV